ncbi:MAG: hypothetical protein LEGION0403_FIIPPAGN_01687 [Legionella sp.]
MQHVAHTEAVAGTAEAVAGTAEAVAGTAEAVAGTAEVVAGTVEVVAGTAEVVVGMAEVVVGTDTTMAAVVGGGPGVVVGVPLGGYYYDSECQTVRVCNRYGHCWLQESCY